MLYHGKQIYEEPFDTANQCRKDYATSINSFLEQHKLLSAKNREDFMPPFKLKDDLEGYRRKYIALLGYPLTEYKPFVPNVKREFVAKDDMCEIFRLQIEVFPDFWFYGILFIPNDITKPAPLVISQHGGGGTPELSSDMHGKNNYNHMTRRVLERKAVVFSPQLLLWNNNPGLDTAPPYGVECSGRGLIDAELKCCGGSITALEITCIMHSIDYLVTLPEVDKNKIGMHGLSYGGYFTLYTMAADPRIKAGYSCGCFNNRLAKFMLDMSMKNSANTFLDAEVAGLCAPRYLYLEVGKEDGVFDYRLAEKEFVRVPKYFDAFGVKENVVFHVWDGGHKVSLTDEGYDFFFDALSR